MGCFYNLYLLNRIGMQRIGLIARCDSTGLGTQSWEFFNHIPCKALVIDFSNMIPVGEHNTILRPHTSRFPGQKVIRWGTVHNLRGDIPTEIIEEFVHDIDILFCIETPYDYNIFDVCRRRGVKTILQLNYEFLDYPSNLPLPDLFAAPSMWNYDAIPEPKVFLPVPVNTERLTVKPPRANTFIHIAGRPAEQDRNGTRCLFSALRYVKSAITVIVKSQTLIHIPNLPANINIICEVGNKENYYDNYDQGGVLVLPRKYGGLCLPINEALSCGMPVITTAISPNNTWLPTEWLVSSHHMGAFQSKKVVEFYHVDQIELAAQIDAHCNQDVYEAARDKAIELRKSISWFMMREKYYEVFENLLA